MNPDGRAYLTVNDAAAIIQASPDTIRRAIYSRRLASVKPNGRHGRTLIRASDLDAWLERSRISAIGES